MIASMHYWYLCIPWNASKIAISTQHTSCTAGWPVLRRLQAAFEETSVSCERHGRISHEAPQPRGHRRAVDASRVPDRRWSTRQLTGLPHRHYCYPSPDTATPRVCTSLHVVDRPSRELICKAMFSIALPPYTKRCHWPSQGLMPAILPSSPVHFKRMLCHRNPIQSLSLLKDDAKLSCSRRQLFCPIFTSAWCSLSAKMGPARAALAWPIEVLLYSNRGTLSHACTTRALEGRCRKEP